MRGLGLPGVARHRGQGGSFRNARSIRACRQPAKAAEPFRREDVLRIRRANISALGVGLPQLDQGVRQRRTVAVEDANLQADPCAGRIRPDQAAERRLVGQAENEKMVRRFVMEWR